MTRAKPPSLLSTRYGLCAPTPGDLPATRSLQLYGEWAEGETDLLSGLITDGHHIVEVGGDFAAHTLWLARAVGETGVVHVVEPRRLPFQQLCANVALNQLGNVHAHHAWFGPGSGMRDLDGEAVRTATLDSLALPALHLLKVNLGNALVDALESAKATIDSYRPLVYSRLSGVDTAEAEVQALKSRGYRVWSHTPALYNPENHAGASRNVFPGILACNVVAAHTESGVDFDHLAEL
ncbi:hypothetical protein [Luteibacter yeojuensis]|uniref:FkbM family methyltransferase n=1 Tax=Luteibacter yeojuensis TaxID=345309 RepID=A0A0F3L0Z0_9GAMM|nr:hypothetical protein [Luteibacter yeojuensis]KJV37128.1 hypothetical protein VI08_00935 [Luteibacter yeojuensis]